jgi:hypothetical protein
MGTFERRTVMNIGDRFFTIAYKYNTKVVEVEITEFDDLDGNLMIHFQRVDKPLDKWYMTAEYMEQWKFKTREEAENRLKEISN